MAILYKPNRLYPDGISLDMSKNQTFTSLINLGGGAINSYNLIIYDSTNNTVLYDTSYLPIGRWMYNGETLEVVVPANSVSNGLSLKWTIAHQDQFNNRIVSFEYPFQSASDPTFTFSLPSTITTQSYNFIASYSQSEGIALKEWYFVFYDGNDNEIFRTDVSFSGNTQYTYDGFIDGSTYKIKAFGETQQRTKFESPLYSFIVDYVSPSVITSPTATVNKTTTSVDVNMGALSQIYGSVTGTSSYINNFMTVGNYGLQLNANAILTINDITIPTAFTEHQVFKFPNTNSRTIVKLSNSQTGDSITVGYSGTYFYKKVNNGYTNGTNYSLNINNLYLIVIRYNKVYIYEYLSDLVTLVSKQML